MPTTDPDNLYSPDTTVPFEQLPAELAIMMASVQEAFDSRGRSYRWPNQASQNLQEGMSAGDTGFRLDTLDIYIYTGSSWILSGSAYRAVGAVVSGIRDLSGQIAREGIHVRAYIQGSSGATLSNGSAVGSVPDWARPPQRAMLSGFAGSNTWSGWVNPDGTIQVYGTGVAGHPTGFYLGGSYMIR